MSRPIVARLDKQRWRDARNEHRNGDHGTHRRVKKSWRIVNLPSKEKERGGEESRKKSRCHLSSLLNDDRTVVMNRDRLRFNAKERKLCSQSSYYLSSSLFRKMNVLRVANLFHQWVRASLMMSSVRRDCREIIVSILRQPWETFIREDIIKIVLWSNLKLDF